MEAVYGIAFTLPFLLVFGAFVAYPILLEVIVSFIFRPFVGEPRVSLENFEIFLSDPLFYSAFRNTLLYVGIAVNIKLILSFFLSGLLTFRNRAVRVYEAVYLLPWVFPLVANLVIFRWMLERDIGIVNGILSSLGFERVNWLGAYTTAMIAIIFFHIWKYTPFWTLVLYAGRQSIPSDLYEAAQIDGAGLVQRLRYVTLPAMRNLYIICTLLSSIFVLGEFVVVWLLTRGGPADTTHMIATLAYRYAFWMGRVNVAAATILSVIPIILVLMFIIFKLRR